MIGEAHRIEHGEWRVTGDDTNNTTINATTAAAATAATATASATRPLEAFHPFIGFPFPLAL